MFTGIIQNRARVVKKEERGGQIHFSFRLVKKEKRKIEAGESIAVNGVCLTARNSSFKSFEADVIRETLEATTLGKLLKGGQVNLERSLRRGDSMGGHFVTGHVDGTGEIVRIQSQGRNKTFSIQAATEVLPFVAPKGSITVDGISLTIQKVKGPVFELGIVPHTLRATTLSNKKNGDRVNLEADLIARYLRACSNIKFRSEILDFEPSRSEPRRAYSNRVCKPRIAKAQAVRRRTDPPLAEKPELQPKVDTGIGS